MNLVRKHKISLITGIPLTGVDKEIIDFIQDKLTGLVPFTSPFTSEYDTIFYMKDGEMILEEVGDRLYIRYHDFYNTLVYKYDMIHVDERGDSDKHDISSIVKYMIELVLGKKIGSISYKFITISVELRYKSYLNTI